MRLLAKSLLPALMAIAILFSISCGSQADDGSPAAVPKSDRDLAAEFREETADKVFTHLLDCVENSRPLEVATIQDLLQSRTRLEESGYAEDLALSIHLSFAVNTVLMYQLNNGMLSDDSVTSEILTSIRIDREAYLDKLAELDACGEEDTVIQVVRRDGYTLEDFRKVGFVRKYFDSPLDEKWRRSFRLSPVFPLTYPRDWRICDYIFSTLIIMPDGGYLEMMVNRYLRKPDDPLWDRFVDYWSGVTLKSEDLNDRKLRGISSREGVLFHLGELYFPFTRDKEKILYLAQQTNPPWHDVYFVGCLLEERKFEKTGTGTILEGIK